MARAGKGKKKAMTAKERKMKYLANLKNDPAKQLAFKEKNKAAVTNHRRNMSEEERTESKKKDATRHKALYRRRGRYRREIPTRQRQPSRKLK